MQTKAATFSSRSHAFCDAAAHLCGRQEGCDTVCHRTDHRVNVGRRTEKKDEICLGGVTAFCVQTQFRFMDLGVCDSCVCALEAVLCGVLLVPGGDLLFQCVMWPKNFLVHSL